MTTVTRERISVAFFNLIKGVTSFTATSRRFVHWDQVNETQMPFLTMEIVEGLGKAVADAMQ